MKRIFLVVTLFLILGISVEANCTFEGKSYSEGTIRGPYICIDGEWIRR